MGSVPVNGGVPEEKTKVKITLSLKVLFQDLVQITMFHGFRWIFLSHFWLRLNWASFLRQLGPGTVSKIGSSLKPNHLKQI